MRIGTTEILDEAITGISLSEALEKFSNAKKCDVILIWQALNPNFRKIAKKTTTRRKKDVSLKS
jgi:hypothetical protein